MIENIKPFIWDCLGWKLISYVRPMIWCSVKVIHCNSMFSTLYVLSISYIHQSSTLQVKSGTHLRIYFSGSQDQPRNHHLELPLRGATYWNGIIPFQGSTLHDEHHLCSIRRLSIFHAPRGWSKASGDLYAQWVGSCIICALQDRSRIPYIFREEILYIDLFPRGSWFPSLTCSLNLNPRGSWLPSLNRSSHIYLRVPTPAPDCHYPWGPDSLFEVSPPLRS